MGIPKLLRNESRNAHVYTMLKKKTLCNVTDSLMFE